MLAQTKSNLARGVPALTYTVDSWAEDSTIPVVAWGEELDISAEDLLRKPDGRLDAPSRDEAVEFLRQLLADGPVGTARSQEGGIQCGHLLAHRGASQEARDGPCSRCARRRRAHELCGEWFIPRLHILREEDESCWSGQRSGRNFGLKYQGAYLVVGGLGRCGVQLRDQTAKDRRGLPRHPGCSRAKFGAEVPHPRNHETREGEVMSKGNRTRRVAAGLLPAPQKCSAHNRDGSPCGASPIRGAKVCRMHGGASPQVRAKAAERLREGILPMLTRLWGSPTTTRVARRTTGSGPRLAGPQRHEGGHQLEVTILPWERLIDGVVSEVDDEQIARVARRVSGDETTCRYSKAKWSKTR